MIKSLKYSQFFSQEMIAGKIPAITEYNKADPDIIKIIDRELSRCLGGVFIDNVFISGWLYWHLNHWWIRDDIEDENANILRRKLRPSLRDNEWMVATYLEQCRVEKKGYMHIGARQFGKSEIMASYLSYNAILFEHTQNVVVGGNDDDLGMLKDKIDFGIKNLWEGIKIPKLTKDAKANMIKLGVKTKNNEDEIWSLLVIRNVSEGKKTEGPAGVTAKAFAIDEIGKFPFAQAFAAAKPAFVSKFGWRCVPLLFGTGGSFEKGADAERFFYHPEANNLLAITDPETGKKTAIFMSGLYRIDCKYKTTLADFLIEQGTIKADASCKELKKIQMDVSDKIKALQLIIADRKEKALDPDKTEYLKLIMYYPLTPQECFLSSVDNYYNRDIAQKQRDKLEESFPGLKVGIFVELEEVQDGETIKITHKESLKLPLIDHPCKDTEDQNTPVVILEHPIPFPPYGLYTAGIDPYRFEKAPNSDSLGAIYIFKRAYDVLSDTFQDMFVAWYVGRPDSKETWNNQARLLIKYYNAIALCENDEMSFIDYMISKGDGQYLMDTPEWIKEYNPTSSANQRQKGVSASPKNIDLFRTTFKSYMEEHFVSLPIPGTTETKKILGISKVNDPGLLDEVIKWNRDGNFDRERAASLAVLCARKLDTLKINPTIQEVDPRFVYNPKLYIPTPFKQTTTYTDYQPQINKLFR